MTLLKYKGYAGTVDVDPEARILHGTVLGIRDVVTFEAKTPRSIEKAFRDSVDDYLAFCEEEGKDPDRPYSGRLVLRMPGELHRKLDILARAHHTSINQLAVAMLEAEADKES